MYNNRMNTIVSSSEYVDVIVNFGAIFLCHTFGNPNYVAMFLLLQFDVSVKDAKLELLQKSVFIERNLN